MPRFTAPSVLDAALNNIAMSTRMTLCSAQPTSLANVDAVKLAEVVMGPSDFTLANGTAGARVMTVSQKTGVTPLGSGEGNHICLDNGSEIKHVGICQQVSISNSDPDRTVTMPSWTITFRGPDA